MEDYKELYSSIQNPLDDLETMKKLLKAYAESSKGLGGFYGKLTKTVEKQYTRGEYDPQDADYFYAMMFNKWKNSILDMSKESFEQLRQQGSFGNDLVTLRNYLKDIPDVKTKQEADDIFRGNFDDKILAGAMEKYKWTAFGKGPDFVHVCSRCVTFESGKGAKIAHRLYLDTESVDTYKMISRFVEKCDEHKLHYYFKFSKYANRDDTIVIYSDMENLANYVQILDEIKQQYPDLVAMAKEPPALTGKIDNWIGYGSEPPKAADGHSQSFNEVRAKVLEKAIDAENKKWIMSHRNQKINREGKIITFQDYVALKATEKFLGNLEKNVNHTFYKGETLQDVAKREGYSVSDVKSSQFRQNIYNVIRNSMGTKLPEICSGAKARDIESVVINVKNGKQISFNGYTLNETIQEMSMEIAKNDSKFLASIKNAISEEAKAYGIDTDKFCFDVSTRDSMFRQTQTRATDSSKKSSVDYKAKKQQITKQEQQTSKKDTKKLYQEKGENEKSIEIGAVDIVGMLNSELMKKRMKLPNGAEMSATQYIQEVVASHIPTDGTFILKNGTKISAKQFIEEIVMLEGQNKYNGDINALLEATTKANNGNNGTITISAGSRGQELQEDPIIDSKPRIVGNILRISLQNHGVTYSDTEKETKEIAERQERKRLLYSQRSGIKMTNEQINRLKILNNLYQDNIPKRDNKQYQGRV